jgi:hypothetical protein
VLALLMVRRRHRDREEVVATSFFNSGTLGAHRKAVVRVAEGVGDEALPVADNRLLVSLQLHTGLRMR